MTLRTVSPLELRVDDLVLRPWRRGDEPAVLAAFRDPALLLWNPPPDSLDETGAAEWVRRRGDWSEGSHASFAVTDGDGQVLGSVSLHRINLGQQDASVGYWTLPPARGAGVAARSVAGVVRWGFESLGLHRVELSHAVDNPASCRVAEKAGFALEGTLRQSYRYGDDRRYDEHLHARLASDPPPPLAVGVSGRRLTA